VSGFSLIIELVLDLELCSNLYQSGVIVRVYVCCIRGHVMTCIGLKYYNACNNVDDIIRMHVWY